MPFYHGCSLKEHMGSLGPSSKANTKCHCIWEARPSWLLGNTHSPSGCLPTSTAGGEAPVYIGCNIRHPKDHQLTPMGLPVKPRAANKRRYKNERFSSSKRNYFNDKKARYNNNIMGTKAECNHSIMHQNNSPVLKYKPANGTDVEGHRMAHCNKITEMYKECTSLGYANFKKNLFGLQALNKSTWEMVKEREACVQEGILGLYQGNCSIPQEVKDGLDEVQQMELVHHALDESLQEAIAATADLADYVWTI